MTLQLASYCRAIPLQVAFGSNQGGFRVIQWRSGPCKVQAASI